MEIGILPSSRPRGFMRWILDSRLSTAREHYGHSSEKPFAHSKSSHLQRGLFDSCAAERKPVSAGRLCYCAPEAKAEGRSAAKGIGILFICSLTAESLRLSWCESLVPP